MCFALPCRDSTGNRPDASLRPAVTPLMCFAPPRRNSTGNRPDASLRSAVTPPGIDRMLRSARLLRPRLPLRSPADRSLFEAPQVLLTDAHALTGPIPCIQFRIIKKGRLKPTLLIIGDSTGNRTRVTAVKGRCLDRLTMEPYHTSLIIHISGSFASIFYGFRIKNMIHLI